MNETDSCLGPNAHTCPVMLISSKMDMLFRMANWLQKLPILVCSPVIFYLWSIEIQNKNGNKLIEIKVR